MTSLYQSVGVVDALEWAWTFLWGNYSDDSEGCSYGQLVIGCSITTTHPLMNHVSCRVFLWNIKWFCETQVTQPFYSPDLVPCYFWSFPKLKSALKGKRFQTVDEIQENTTRQLMCEVPRCLLRRGLRCHCLMYNVSCIFFNKCVYFSYYAAGYFLDRPLMCIRMSAIVNFTICTWNISQDSRKRFQSLVIWEKKGLSIWSI